MQTMKFFAEKYRVISIWLSLTVLALGFVIGSDDERRAVCVFLAFVVGTLLYSVGAAREWMLNRIPACLIEALLAVCMLTASILSLLRLGGII